MKTELTPEEEAICEQVAAEYDQILVNPLPCTVEAVRPWVDRLFTYYQRPVPKDIYIVDSPEAAFRKEAELADSKTSTRTLDASGLADAGWCAFYDFWHRIKVLSDDEAKDVLLFREYIKCAYDSVMMSEAAIVIRHPKKILRDLNGEIHCADGPAVEWHDGDKVYFWHGVKVTEQIIERPESFGPEGYRALTNTEHRRALSERLGWDKVLEMLGAEKVDGWTDPKTGLGYELLRSGQMNYLRKQSPKLKNGVQPFYVEPVHEELRTAAAARKWQATRATVDECERDPSLSYAVEA